MRVFDPGIEGSFNAEVRKLYPEITDAFGQRAENMDNRGLGDGAMNPRAATVLKTAEDRSNELQKIHAFIQDLGTTYYGKQFIVPLNETICAYQGENFQEKIFSSVPTNAGGWIEGDVAILGISDPELGLFRSDDNRVTSFGVFTISGDSEDGGGDPEDPGNPYNTSPPPDSYSQGDHTPD
jgi:hypothetical protein